MFYSFTATCFGSYTKSHHQDDKVPKKWYIRTPQLFNIVFILVYD